MTVSQTLQDVRLRLIRDNDMPKLPENWTVERFRFLFRESKERNGPQPVGDMLSVSEYRGVVPREYVHDEQRRSVDELQAYRVVRPGQLAVNTMWLNHLGLGVSKHLGHVSPAYAVYDISGRLDGRFVHHLLRSQFYLKIYLRYLYGIRPNSFQIKSDDWRAMPVIVPPLEAQRAIADFLDHETARINLLIEKKEQLLNGLTERLNAYVQRAVLGGAKAARATGRNWLSNLPDGWQLIPLKHVVSVVGGATPSKDREEFWQGDIAWVSPKDMKADTIKETAEHISEVAVERSSLTLIRAGAILIVVRGMILARTIPVSMLGMRATINQDMKALLPNEEFLCSEYLQRMLQGFQDVLMSFVEEAAHGTKKLRSDQLLSFKLPVPPRLEQHEIVDMIERERIRVSKVSDLTLRSIERLREFRSALITAAVTGQIDLDAWSRHGVTDRRLDRINSSMAASEAVA